MKRTERLFAIAEILRSRRTGITAGELAERFGVSERTMYRDLDALRMANLPLLADPGRGGGYALSRSYQLPPVNFSAREAAVLVAAAEWLTRFRLLPFVDTLNDAVAKVRTAMPDLQRRRVAAVVQSLSFVGVPSRPVEPAIRRAIEQAWYEDVPVQITYHGANHVETTRRIRIRSVIVDRAETLLNCDDLDKGAERQFKLHRITRAELADP